MAQRKYTDSTSELAADILESAQQLVHLEIALAKQEARELAIRNGIAAGMLAGAALLGMLALLVALPVLVIVLVPAHWVAALAWVVLYAAAAALLALLGRARLALHAPPRTIASLKETKAWVLHQLNTSSR